MTLEEEVVALRADNAAPREQLAVLEGQVAGLQQRIEELQQKGKGTPRFVKANRPKVMGAKAPRRKREAEHNRGRGQDKPTKVVVHELEHCPD